MDQARGRSRGRHDGSHRLRRDALKRNTITEGLAKAGPSLFSVQIVLLGTAAGGGFPQWNCWCPSCRVARQEPSRARRRTQSSRRRERRRGALVPPQRLARRARAAGTLRGGPARLRPPARAGGRDRAHRRRAGPHARRRAAARGPVPSGLGHRGGRGDPRSRFPDPPGHPGLRPGAPEGAGPRRAHAAALPGRLSQRDDRARLSRAGRSASLRRRRSGPAIRSGCWFGTTPPAECVPSSRAAGGLDDALLAAARPGGPGAVRRDLLDRRRADPASHRRAHRAADGSSADRRAGRQPRAPGPAAGRGSGSIPTSTTPTPC